VTFLSHEGEANHRWSAANEAGLPRLGGWLRVTAAAISFPVA